VATLQWLGEGSALRSRRPIKRVDDEMPYVRILANRRCEESDSNGLRKRALIRKGEKSMSRMLVSTTSTNRHPFARPIQYSTMVLFLMILSPFRTLAQDAQSHAMVMDQSDQTQE